MNWTPSLSQMKSLGYVISEGARKTQENVTPAVKSTVEIAQVSGQMAMKQIVAINNYVDPIGYMKGGIQYATANGEKVLQSASCMVPYMAWGTIGGCIAPAVVTTAVSSIGFGACGISTGSIAAGMMSASAIANGGGVASGSLVAVSQSIGAVGLGTLAVPVVVGGVVLGACIPRMVGSTYPFGTSNSDIKDTVTT